MALPREFSLEEANGLVPRLTLEFSRIARLRQEVAALAKSLGGADAAVELLERKRLPEAGEEQGADRLRLLADDIGRTLARINELGCVVKDVELGLVDFHGELDSKKVFLCWQYGESGVAHYHGLDEGFAGRKPLLVSAEEEPPTAWLN